MKLSLDWLNDFVKLKKTPEQLAQVLEPAGFEVERINTFGRGFEHVIVGQIKTIVNHADADKLSVCKVDIGQAEYLNIVCGAKNIRPDQKVPVAMIGATLPGGMVIERRKIRGIESEGMLCAPDELGLGTDHSGIMILDKGLPVGKLFGLATGLEDTVLDVNVTPNRADCYSVIGLAREVSAVTGQPFALPKVNVKESKKFAVKKLLSVTVKDKELCPKYTARVVRNVKVRPSPQWLQSRLIVSGLSPINNIVDITNYIMLEYGQPLHAFDLNVIQGRKIIVRRAGRDQQFETLDGEKRPVPADALMICDAKDPIAVAGVMGGKNSEITRQTKDIVIESAIFKSVSIRRTRQKLGIVTEASLRFEKGIWTDLPEQACDRAAQLLVDIAGGEVATGMVVVSAGKPLKEKKVKFSLTKLNSLIGHTFTSAQVKLYAERLGFKLAKITDDDFSVIVPAWRQDISIPADIAEEVGRLYGWSKIMPSPVYAALTPRQLPREKKLVRMAKDSLVASGFTETLNYSFYGRTLAERFGLNLKDHYRVLNPLNPEQEYMRICLLPRLHDVILKNYQGRKIMKVFEVGRVFVKRPKGLPEERTLASAMVYQKEGAGKVLRGVLDGLARDLNLANPIHVVPVDGAWRTADLKCGQQHVGEYGEIRVSAEKLGAAPVYITLDLNVLVGLFSEKRDFTPVPQFPAVERDLTFVADPDTDYYQVAETVKKADALISAVKGTKYFTSTEGERHMTLHIVYQAPDHTLESGEVEAIQLRIVAELKNKFGMVIRKQ
ncbi:MAG: phenylalanine--tRNA ligase subunit beta [Patescibacteria group bacterium]